MQTMMDRVLQYRGTKDDTYSLYLFCSSPHLQWFIVAVSMYEYTSVFMNVCGKKRVD